MTYKNHDILPHHYQQQPIIFVTSLNNIFDFDDFIIMLSQIMLLMQITDILADKQPCIFFLGLSESVKI